MSQKGFTLIELMVTLTVLGVLLSVGVPSFSDTVRNSRSQAAANELVLALNAARVEAVKRGVRVSACPSINGATCAGTTWQSGWIVFVDAAASDTATPAVVGSIIARRAAMPSGATATGTATFIRYSGLGFAPVSSNIRVQTSSCIGLNARTISFSTTGRISMQKVNCT